MKPTTIEDLNGILFPFQRKAVEFHLSHHYSINGCKMGLGKTIQAIATLAHVKGPACIVCPAYLRQNWLSEIDKFLPDSHEHLITVLSYEKFVRFAPNSCHILIFDEAHYLKNMQSKRTKFAHNYVKSKLPAYLLLLSGTPIKNRVTDFYSPMKLCSYNPQETSGLALTKGFSAFAETLCNSETIRTPYGNVKKYSGLKNRPILIKYLKGKYFSARNDKPLPELQRQNITIDTLNNKELMELLEEDFAENHISTAKKNIAVEKSVFTVKYLKDCIANGETPLLVFSDHVDSCRAIKTQLTVSGIKDVEVITGSTPPEERNRLVVLFQQKRIAVLVCTIGSMSTGFTLTATNRVVFNDLSWCPADNEQAEKRIHRIGQTKDCYVIHLVAQGIDKKITQVLQDKQKTIKKVYFNT